MPSEYTTDSLSPGQKYILNLSASKTKLLRCKDVMVSINIKSSHQRCSIKKAFLEASNFIRKETLAQEFSCEFCGVFKDTFFTEHFRATASLVL